MFLDFHVRRYLPGNEHLVNHDIFLCIFTAYVLSVYELNITTKIKIKSASDVACVKNILRSLSRRRRSVHFVFVFFRGFFFINKYTSNNRRQFCFWCKCVRSYSKYIQLCPLFFASFGRILILSLFNKIYREIKSGCLTYECSKNHASIGKVWTKLWALIVLNNLIIELVKRKHFAAEQNQLCSSKSNTYELILCGR